MGNRRRRDFNGRFAGSRANVENVPRLPTFPARWVLDDPRRRPYFVLWTSEDDDCRYGLKMAPGEEGDAVLITLENGETSRIPILRRPLPRGTGTALFYRCLWCQKPRRSLYRLTLSGRRLVDYLGLRCRACAGLRFASQGCYRGVSSARCSPPCTPGGQRGSRFLGTRGIRAQSRTRRWSPTSSRTS